MQRRFNPWLVAYAISMTLIVVWFGCLAVIDHAWLAYLYRVDGLTGADELDGIENWLLGESFGDPIRRNALCALAVALRRKGSVGLAVLIPIVVYLCWLRSRPRPDRRQTTSTPTDLSLE